MTLTTDRKLLKNKKAVAEINRHRWIESEKAGYDVGFKTASADWLEKFSKVWMQYHMPNRKKTPSRSAKSYMAKRSSPHTARKDIKIK